IAVLEAAGMERRDLVKVNVLLTRAGDVAASRTIRDEALQGAAPASTLAVISALAHPDLLFEVEAVAARPACIGADQKDILRLRREPTRSQAQLAKAESQRDRLLEHNRKLRKLMEEAGLKVPARLRWPDNN